MCSVLPLHPMAPLPLHAARGALPRAVRPAARARGACGTKVWVPLVTSQVAARGGQARKASGRPVADFKVGDAVTGTVTQIYCPGGVSVDVGCETLAFLEVEETQKTKCLVKEFSDGFPAEGPFRFRPGDTVHARVLDVNPDARVEDHGEPDPFGEHGDTGKLHLTLRSGPLERPTRFVADASRRGVVMMSNWAVYVKVQRGEESFVGILELEEFSKDFAQDGEMLREDEDLLVAIRGCEVQVRIKEVDLESRRLLLTMRHMDADSASEQRRAPAAGAFVHPEDSQMEGKVNMEKPDHSADVSKQRKPKTMLGGIQPWAVGAASCGVVLLCAGAWCLWHQAQEEARILQAHSESPLGRRGAKVKATKLWAMAKINPADIFAKDWKAFQKVVEEVPEEFEKLIERRRAALDRKAEKNLLTIPMEMDTPPEMRQSTACDFSRRPSAESGCRAFQTSEESDTLEDALSKLEGEPIKPRARKEKPKPKAKVKNRDGHQESSSSSFPININQRGLQK
eukprot:g20894.t2